MPGYNVVGPAEAFSTTLEDAILKHEVAQHQAKIAERQAKLDQAKLSQDKAYLELAQKQQENQQEDRKTALAEKAAAAKEKEGTDIAGRLVTGDVITPDIAKVLPPGLTVPGTPATPAVPAGPNTAPLAGTSIPMERDVANATPAVPATPPTFRGLPAARIAAAKKAEQDRLIAEPPESASGYSPSQKLRFAQSGLPISELNPPKETDVKISYLDPKTGKNMEKWVSPAEAKAMGPQVAPTPASVVIHNETAAKEAKDTGTDATTIPGWTQSAIDMEAVNRAKGAPLPAFGMMQKGEKTRALGVIENRAAQYDAAQGKFIDDPSYTSGAKHEIPDLALNKSDLHANATALTKLQSQHSAVNAFSSAATHNADLLEQTLRSLPDSGNTWLNRPIRDAAAAFGSENMAAFNVFRKSLQDEYARIISNPNLTGVLSDTAREEMATILSPTATVGQIRASLKALKAESKNREQGLQGEIDVIRGRIKGGPQNAPPADTDAGAAAYAAYVQSQGRTK